MKRVMMVGDISMLSVGIENLIRKNGAFEFRRVKNFNSNNAGHEIMLFQPQVLILEQASILDFPALFQVLNCANNMIIILIDNQDNLLHVYNKVEFHISTPGDFVNVLHQDFGPIPTNQA